MEEANKTQGKKKIGLLIALILLIVVIVIGTSYAFWRVNKTQQTSNRIKTDCLDIELSDVTDAISLEKTHPISDEEAKSLTPYEFKIKNTCNTKESYSVNLEVMELSDQLKSEYIAISLNNEPKEILSTKQAVTPTYKGSDYTASESYFLTNGELEPNGEINYTLRLWMDESVSDAESMNKRFISKISVNAEQLEDTNLVEYLKSLESSELVEDDFGNLRYIGANPNNYVTFNNEKWRIIGVMKDIENADGTKEDKVKLIRSESIGQYSWDNKAAGVGSSTSEYGSNDWSDSALQKVLNEGAYWNRTSGNCPSGKNGVTIACDFSEAGLTESAKSMISESIWNLSGSHNYSLSSAEVTPKKFYELERGEDVYNGSPTTWTGKVGLMYPSDYGYATAGGNTKNRATCLNTRLYSWSSDDCVNNDWLFFKDKLNKAFVTINQYPSVQTQVFAFNYSGGRISQHIVTDSSEIIPVVYLKSKTIIEEGNNGSSSSPFVLK